MTLQFQRSPFMPLTRTVFVPWNQIVVLPPVVMTLSKEGELYKSNQPPSPAVGKHRLSLFLFLSSFSSYPFPFSFFHSSFSLSSLFLLPFSCSPLLLPFSLSIPLFLFFLSYLPLLLLSFFSSFFLSLFFPFIFYLPPFSLFSFLSPFFISFFSSSLLYPSSVFFSFSVSHFNMYYGFSFHETVRYIHVSRRVIC